MAEDAKEGPAGPAKQLAAWCAALESLVKLIIFAAVFIWLVQNPERWKAWIDSITHLEIAGVKIDFDALRKDIARFNLDDTADADLVAAALTRANHVAPAIEGAKVLWVDDNPTSEANNFVRKYLGIFRVQVDLSKNNAEAAQLLENTKYDIVISDVYRAGQSGGQLKNCKVAYFDWPDPSIESQFKTLPPFNENQNDENAPAGIALAESLSVSTGVTRIPVIFFAARNAEIARSLCGYAFVNRVDTLLQKIVSALEEERWQKLNPKKAED
jgi:CheY-like chemotaxis protein